MPENKPIKWAVPLVAGPGILAGPWNGTFNGEYWTSNQPAEPADTLTQRKLYDMMQSMPDPHPLSGLDQVLYASNMADAAHAFVAEYNKPPRFGPAVIASLSVLLPPGHIVGLRGKDIVLIAGPEKELAEDQPQTGS